MTPIIVAGPQRCGTRFVTNILNSVPEVTVHGEIPLPIMKYLIKVVNECEARYLNDQRKYIGENWNAKKQDFMFATWANMSKGKNLGFHSKCLYYGYKTPFHEKYFDFYNSFFYPTRPKYVCCIRFFHDHYFSVHARWPHRSIVKVSKRYVQSLRQIRYMKKKRREDVMLFFLDDYKRTGFEYVRQSIFFPLGLHNLSPAEQKAQQGPVNSSVQMGVKRKEKLNILQNIFLRIYTQPLVEYNSLRHEFGYHSSSLYQKDGK